jgi:hypothetical protein
VNHPSLQHGTTVYEPSLERPRGPYRNIGRHDAAMGDQAEAVSIALEKTRIDRVAEPRRRLQDGIEQRPQFSR